MSEILLAWFVSLEPAERLLVFLGFAVSWIVVLELWIARAR